MALRFLDDPAADLYAPEPPQRSFTLAPEMAAQLAAIAARFGSTPADELATALQLHFDALEGEADG